MTERETEIETRRRIEDAAARSHRAEGFALGVCTGMIAGLLAAYLVFVVSRALIACMAGGAA